MSLSKDGHILLVHQSLLLYHGGGDQSFQLLKFEYELT